MIRKPILLLLTVCSVALLVAGVVSYWQGIPDEFILISTMQPRRAVQAAVTRGVVHVVLVEPASKSATSSAERRFGPFYVKREEVGFTVANGFGVPFWFLSGVMLVWLVLACLRGPLRRRARRRRGECVVCGYSLQGLSLPRCPECGTSTPNLPDGSTPADKDTSRPGCAGAPGESCTPA